MNPHVHPETERLYHAYKPLLFSLSYRMLGSVMDAEDVVQDVFLTVAHHDEIARLEHPKAYLCKMAANRCVDRLRSARTKRETYVGPWLPEPLFTDEANAFDPEERLLRKDSLSTAYLLLLERLSEAERAVFLLRESFGYEYSEIAGMLDKSEANCRKLYSRASAKMFGAAREEPLDGSSWGAASGEAAGGLLERFVTALAVGDATAALRMLSEGALLLSDGGGKVTAAVRPIEGADKIIRFLIGIETKTRGKYSVEFREVNGRPGMALLHDGHVSNVFSFDYDLDQNQIKAIYLVANPDKLLHLRQPSV